MRDVGTQSSIQTPIISHFSEFITLSKIANQSIPFDPELAKFEDIAMNFVNTNRRYIVQIYCDEIKDMDSSVEVGLSYEKKRRYTQISPMDLTPIGKPSTSKGQF